MKRRFAAPILVTLVVLAGCSGTLVEVSAQPAAIPEAVWSTTAYTHGNTSAAPLTYPVAVGPVVRNVTATTYVAGYANVTPTGLADGVVVVWSTPDHEIAGRSVNPAGTLSDPALVEFLFERVRSVRDLASVEEVNDLRLVARENLTVLGTPTELTTYRTTVEGPDGVARALAVHVAVIEHEGDVIVAIGMHDATRPESAAIRTLIGGIDHPRPLSEVSTRADMWVRVGDGGP